MCDQTTQLRPYHVVDVHAGILHTDDPALGKGWCYRFTQPRPYPGTEDVWNNLTQMRPNHG